MAALEHHSFERLSFVTDKTGLLTSNLCASLVTSRFGDQTQLLEFSLDVLAGLGSSDGGVGGNATTVTLSISPPTPQRNNTGNSSADDGVAHSGGTRHGTLRISAPRITTSWDPWGALESNFTLLSDETALQLRVVVDRSIVEVWAAGGRAVISVRDFPAASETAVRLRHGGGGGGGGGSGDSSLAVAAGGDAPLALRVERVEGWGMGCGWQS